MGFLGVYRAIYDYSPQGEGELTISEGDILYVLEKSGEDNWWRAKKKASGDDEDEPVGLIPNNYIEEASPSQHARALFDYTRQTDEELSFSEDAHLEVFDTSDPDWILVGFDGEYGFAPSNYIDLSEDVEEAPAAPARPPALPQRASSPDVQASQGESPRAASNPAAALAGILSGRKVSTPVADLPPRPQYTPDASDEDEQSIPSLPARPHSQSFSPQPKDYPAPDSPQRGIQASPPHNKVSFRDSLRENHGSMQSPGGFHLYNISEMVSVMGKRKKMPTTFGINLATGKLMIAPEKARDGATQEWTADKMTHYSIEGKHVFVELIRPSKSVDFHAGAKDTAQEIVRALGELAGVVRAEEGLREVYMAGSGQNQRKGIMLYDFMAQGDDEVSVAVDDEVIVIDDTKSDEWWQVRRVKNGKEGVVPSSYVEITGVTSLLPSSSTGVNAGKSTVEKNRLEEQRLTKEAAKDIRGQEVGPGMRLPERGSSLSAGEVNNNIGQQRRGPDQPEPIQQRSKAKPDQSKIRTWTDRSKSFSVEAQFLALKDGKINLHKVNGVKIAVPVVKMSVEDLEYVEGITGISLDEDKPLSDIKGRKQRQEQGNNSGSASTPAAPAGISLEQSKKPEYDWFQFFLDCDVAVGVCERYAQVFHRDSMEESVLPDVDGNVLRNLGLREGDILKVMRYLDQKFGRGKRNASLGGENGEDGETTGGLFSGPGGALRNNTRKGRPAPAIQTNDVVDPRAFSQSSSSAPVSAISPTSSTPVPTPLRKDGPGGFDDDAWDIKPSKQQPQQSSSNPPQPSRPQSQQPTLTVSMQELSLLSQPLEPVKVQPTVQQQPQQPPAQQQASQPTGATPGFFSGVNSQQTGQQQQPALNGAFSNNPQFTGQQPQYGQQLQTPQAIARQRPMAPQQYQSNSLMPPPPPRPLSAPQSAQQSAFGPPPLQPQMTGVPNSAFQSSPLAPPGQSLAEINQMRMQQQYDQQQQQLQQQMTGFQTPQSMMSQQTGFQGQQGMILQQPGFGNINPQQNNGFGQQMQPQQTGFNQMQGGPFADPRNQQFSPVQQQPTGFQSQFNPLQFPQQSGVNNFLPPALIPQKTAMQPQQTSMNGFGQPPQGFSPLSVPPMPQQNTITPLMPQKTGPPPPVRFGVTGDTKKLMPQATGRRANLASATPQNPFGF